MSAATPAPDPNKRLMFHVTFYIADSDAEEFLKHLRTTFEAVTAEPECLFVDTYWDPNHHGTIRIVEEWACDRDWFVNVQMPKKYYDPYRAATEKMYIKERTVEDWERIPGWWRQKPDYKPE
ncbi:uncharacterized protein Z520_05702 [Fonsecaea multimorphosa CBS 102226]|uniref:ABM domain-containing protein n=1 Tax=Fonsecaea multimorphosa CBS 102226 TaxID=1442371 RepID=A0A0D2IN16_9EURO|nr:uncharacterized protein Z520_05702 [Fonsecaea multimorphosa CBS 102226]KIX98401.1 hypothetical protein Z520_05702 [Fonsecaea multimorphosa CBS 102226]OAL24595.1 hypothetical protein AYO22_05384 [Fonsecaea multimorphosa]